ncbi:MAG: hypothetical protein ACI9MU_001357, partial [Alphaproteobacteria bacterium]
MAAAKRFDPRELVESKLPGTLRTPDGDPVADGLSSVETALQEMRNSRNQSNPVECTVTASEVSPSLTVLRTAAE